MKFLCLVSFHVLRNESRKSATLKKKGKLIANFDRFDDFWKKNIIYFKIIFFFRVLGSSKNFKCFGITSLQTILRERGWKKRFEIPTEVSGAILIEYLNFQILCTLQKSCSRWKTIFYCYWNFILRFHVQYNNYKLNLTVGYGLFS